MGNGPDTIISLLQPHRCTHPHVHQFSVGHPASDVIEVVREGDVITGGDVQIVHLIADRAVIPPEPLLQAGSDRLRANSLQRGSASNETTPGAAVATSASTSLSSMART